MASNMIRKFMSKQIPSSGQKMALFSSSTISDRDPVIVAATRTPIASFGGSLASVPAPRLGAAVIEDLMKRTGLPADAVEEVFMGNVVSSGQGQAPARQAVLYAGLDKDTPCTTVNKVCASGMKTVMLAAMSVQAGYRDVMIAGGMESMSNIPYYQSRPSAKYPFGHNSLDDGLIKDGLWDVYNNQHMGMCAEACADSFSFSREEQDAFAVQSYERSQAATAAGKFARELCGVSVPQRRGDPVVVTQDEEIHKVKLDKIPSLRSAFKKNGTVTAANASSLSDGASGLMITSYGKAKELGLEPIARIRGYGDAGRDPVEFTIAPADAVPRALKMAGLAAEDMDFHEVNEAFSVVVLANQKLLGLNPDRVNVYGGAVSLGHPIGCSGARIITTLCSVLQQEDGTFGTASICNGGGGASAIVLERLS